MEKLTLLIVEDDEMLLESMVSLLEITFDVNVVVAENALVALKVINSKPVDLIISDIHMPQMSGLEMTSILRSQGAQVPVIICSGYADKENLLRSLSLQIFEFLEKPVPPEKLFSAIQRGIDHITKGQRYQLSRLELNQQQQDILELLLAGHSNQHIGEKMKLAEPTVKNHVGRLLKKFEAKDRTDLKPKVQNAILSLQFSANLVGRKTRAG